MSVELVTAVVAVIVALIGGGGFVAFRKLGEEIEILKAESAKIKASTGLTEAETDSIVVEASRAALAVVRTAMTHLKDDLEASRSEAAGLKEQLTDLKVAIASLKAELETSRLEIVGLKEELIAERRRRAEVSRELEDEQKRSRGEIKEEKPDG